MEATTSSSQEAHPFPVYAILLICLAVVTALVASTVLVLRFAFRSRFSENQQRDLVEHGLHGGNASGISQMESLARTHGLVNPPFKDDGGDFYGDAAMSLTRSSNDVGLQHKTIIRTLARSGKVKGGAERIRGEEGGVQDETLSNILARNIKAAATKLQTIGPNGGSIECFGCKINFPPGAVFRETEIKMSVITDFSDSPKGLTPVTPMLECNLDCNPNLLMHVEMLSWARPRSLNLQIQQHLCRKDRQGHWSKFIEYVTLNSDATISFSTKPFAKLGVFSDVDNHLIRSTLDGIPPTLDLTMRTKYFVHINPDGVVALVWCLSTPKVMDDVESSLAECGYIHSLLEPEVVEEPYSERLWFRIVCSRPDILKIRGLSERSIKVSNLSRRM